MDDDSNIRELPVKPRKNSPGPFQVVPRHGATGCQHRRFQIDERLDSVSCRDCNEKLSPMWVLLQLANEDDRLRNEWARMRALLETMKAKTKTKCRHCQKMTPIPADVSDWVLTQRAWQIRNDGTAP